jgi:hypothetical protein
VTISGDGSYLALISDSTDLIAGQVGSGGNVFLLNRVAGLDRKRRGAP